MCLPWLKINKIKPELFTKTLKMKKRLLLLFTAVAVSTSLIAGGIMTNTNQSASYVRMLSRNASTSIDAVYYNPAGLTKLNNGFHISLNNQTIFQTKDVVNNYPYLHNTPSAKYTGDVKAPLFPGVYLAYKTNKLAFSFGFNPVGGGGGAKYDTGLPSFEMGISELVPKLKTAAGVTNYQAAINFEGTSVFFGYQGGVSYKINDMISVFGGVRYVTAKNTYKGAIKDITINPNIPGNANFNGSYVRADAFGTAMAQYYTSVATQLAATATSLQPIISGGGAGLTLAQLQGLGLITSTQQAQLAGALAQLGLSQAQIAAMNATQIQGAFNTGAATATGGATQMAGLAAATGDKEVDAEQKGTGITPILGVNLTLAEKLELAIKYEFFTKLELTNKTKVDNTGMFKDGDKVRSDMPAMLSIGASYPVSSKLGASLSVNYYFDKSANYGKKNEAGESVDNSGLMDKNFFEASLGLEYKITDKFLVSAGFLTAQTGVTEAYQSDLSYSLSSNTVGLGLQYKINDNIALNLGGLNVFYGKDSKSFTRMLGTTAIPVTEDYSKTTWMLSAGLDVRFGK